MPELDSGLPLSRTQRTIKKEVDAATAELRDLLSIVARADEDTRLSELKSGRPMNGFPNSWLQVYLREVLGL